MHPLHRCCACSAANWVPVGSEMAQILRERLGRESSPVQAEPFIAHFGEPPMLWWLVAFWFLPPLIFLVVFLFSRLREWVGSTASLFRQIL